MARSIAAQIRDGAAGRRERERHTRTDFVIVSPEYFTAPPREVDRRAGLRSAKRQKSSSSDVSHNHLEVRQNVLSVAALSPLGRAWELDATMTYMDHVFPFLFPFYRPSLLATSRAWLLSFVTLNAAISHSVLSLSSFFITVGLKECHPDRAPCNSVIWSQVVAQAEKSFEMIRKDLAEADTRQGGTAQLLHKARTMETIIQLLVFELIVGGSSGAAWQAHLAPAVALLEDLTADDDNVAYREDSGGGGGLAHVLDQMAWPPPSFPKLSEQRHLWNPDQAAFRFFAAVLLVLDILASVALRHTPRLRHYHSRLLPDMEPAETTTPALGLSHVVGCQNWVLRAIGETAALDEWKKTQREAGTFARAEMVGRAAEIYQLLSEGFARLEEEDKCTGSTVDPLRQCLLASPRPQQRVSPTRVWAHAARIYLSLAANGWTPSDPEVRRDVARALELLGAADSLAELRALAWPLCVAGCLAEAGEAREAFEGILARVRGSQLLGALREVDKTVAAVWGLEVVDGDWDVAACLEVLGAPALLF